MSSTATCQDCGGPATRVDTPLPAFGAPRPWWHHASEAAARACPGRGPVLPRPVTVRAGDLVPGDVYANEDGTPVLDELASHGGVPVGAIPRPFVAAVPLTVASVTPTAPLGGEPAVYVEASNGHGSTVPANGKTRIVQRGETGPAVAQESAGQPETCAKCGYPVMRSWGGYGHAPGYRGKRHVVTVAA